MLKKALTITITFLVIAIAVIYFFVDQQLKIADHWNALPASASLIIEIDNPGELFQKLEAENQVWQSLLFNHSIRDLRSELVFIDSIQKQYTASSFLAGSVCISFHPEKGKTEVLLIANQKNSQDIQSLEKFLNGRFELKTTSSDKNIYSAIDANSDTHFFFYLKNNLLVASASQTLINKSFATLSSKKERLTDNPDIVKLRSLAGANVDAKVFLNYRGAGNFLSNLANAEMQEKALWLSKFADWTGLDVIVKKNEVLMTGFTLTGLTENNFVNRFKNQQPVEPLVFNVLPFNTNQLLWLGFSNFSEYPVSKDIKTLSSKVNFDLTELLSFVSGEIALAGNSVFGENNSNQSWFLAKVSNTSKIKSILKQLSKNTKGESSAEFSGFPVGEINADDLIPGLFGDAFSIIRKNWYTLIGNYVVVANSRSGIESFIRFYETGKTLDLNENFKAFSDNISRSSTILLFVKPRDFTEKGSVYLNKNSNSTLKENEKTLKNLEGLVFQYSSQNDILFTNFYLKNNSNYKEENLALWKTQLDDEIAGRPFLVKDHNTGNYNIVVFDKLANIYLVSTDGRIIWKKRADALPESLIYEVDYYKNGKIQYLFNSPDFIYLIDKNGDFVEGYPKKLNPSATNGLCLMDYKNNKDYRMMVAQADKRIYNYKINGQQVNGWSKPRTDNLVFDEVQRLVADGKDYFMINDAEDNISIVNRRGNQRVKLKQNPEKAKNSNFYVNKTNSKGIILSTDVKGKLFYISASGNLEYTDFGDFSETHFFLYEDFNGDGAPDFIYLDGDQLKVFDRFKNILFSYQFNSPISIKPEFFQLEKRKKVMGVVADQEKTIYLFDNNGNILISKGLIGETPFTVGSLENNHDLNLLTGTGNVLYNYRID